MEPPVCVLGDSHVRSFARSRAFLPLFLGPGRATCFMDEARARSVEARLGAVLARLPQAWPVLLVLGEPDVRQFLDGGGAPADGAAFIDGCVARYVAMVERLLGDRRRRFALYNVVPSGDAARTALAARYNRGLAAACAARGWAFVDLWNAVVDRATGLVDPRHAADPIHLGESAAPLAAARLVALGLWLSQAPYAEDFAWSYLYRLDIAGHEVRVWGGAATGERGALYGPADRVLEAIAAARPALVLAGRPRVAVIAGREGLAALALPRGRGILAIDADPGRVEAAGRLALVAGRPDITPTVAATADAIVGAAAGADLVIVPEPADLDAASWPDLARRLAASARLGVLVLTPGRAVAEAMAAGSPRLRRIVLPPAWGAGGAHWLHGSSGAPAARAFGAALAVVAGARRLRVRVRAARPAPEAVS